jgi:hypothetical protein
VGLVKRGQDSKLMVLVDGQGLPLGTMVASAQEAEVHLAEATVETVRVPRRRGRPRKRVRGWWRTGHTTAIGCGVGFVGEGFGPAFRGGEIVVSGDARRSCRGIGSGGWCSTLGVLGKDP